MAWSKAPSNFVYTLVMKPKIWLLVSGICLVLVGLAAALFANQGNINFESSTQNDVLSESLANRVIAAGDISCPASSVTRELECRQADTASLALSLKPKAVLALGDLQYPGGALADFKASYAKSWGKLKTITYPVPGNHEYLTKDASGYFNYFGSRASPKNGGYFSFDLGSWHIVAINSEIDVSDTSAQRIWLRADLAATRQPCIMAYWHQPRFSTGFHTDNAKYQGLWQDLYKAGADVVINGHSHDYERFLPLDPAGKIDRAKGITEFVSGMGGYGQESMNASNNKVATRQNNVFGLLQLDLAQNGLHYKFVAIPGSPQFRDEGFVSCHS